MVYDRLDALRERTAARLAQVHRGDHAGNDQAMSERQSFHEMYSTRLAQLGAVERGLCFGRLDVEDGERIYVGRLGLFDDDYEPVLVDWRTPVAQPFYRATPAERLGVVRRRHLRTRGRTVVGIDDDLLDFTGLDDEARQHLTGEAALLASLSAGRTGRMADIVATIQAEQDRVIRSDLAGILVVEGGAGTGKTVVALHRAAYLLYTHRDRLARRGVLILGPNPTFMRYIDQVLPSLGETEAVLATVAELYPGVVATGQDDPEAERLKGDPRMAEVIATAVRNRQRIPDDDRTVVVDRACYTLDRLTCARAREAARRRGRELGERHHNRVRRHFVRRVLDVLTQQAVDRLGGADLLDDADVADLRRELATDPGVRDLLDDLWPELTPERLLRDLYADEERLAAAAPWLTDAERAALRRDPSHPWTPADVPLLDEAAELLGELDATLVTAREAAMARAKDEQEESYEAWAATFHVAASGELGLTADDVEPVAAMVADRYRRSGPDGPVADTALADRHWTYGHVIVDEAQELSAMAWRMVMRRCPARSMTVVGDLAQASAPGSARSWADVLEPYAAGRWRRERLRVNYRTPREFMALANDVLAAIDPTLEPPRSVREAGEEPWSRCVDEAALPEVLTEVVSAERAIIEGGEQTDAEQVDTEPSGQAADARSGGDGSGGEPTGEGRVAVIVPAARLDQCVEALADHAPGTAAAGVASVLDSPVAVLTVVQAKGLEFDAVVVVDPAGLLAESPRGTEDLYVALTRATRRLGVVSLGPLPDVLSRLDRSEPG